MSEGRPGGLVNSLAVAGLLTVLNEKRNGPVRCMFLDDPTCSKYRGRTVAA